MTDQAQNILAFMGITKPEPSDLFILVMGKTGSGKSTFINKCTGKYPKVSHGLNSCTSSVETFCFTKNNRRIYLIDTPGFNDTAHSDMEILNILATYLSASYTNNIRIHGLIILHPISDNRIQGSSLRNIEIIKAVYGYESYNNVAIVTTMWPDRLESIQKGLGERELQLLTTDQFFGDFIAMGATKFRYNETGCRDSLGGMFSAQDIINHLITRSDFCPSTALRLQYELSIERKSVGETAAGIIIADLAYKVSQKYGEELKRLDTELKVLCTRADDSKAVSLQKSKTDIKTKLNKVECDMQTLDKRITRLQDDSKVLLKERLEDIDKELHKEVLLKEKELRDMEDSLHRTNTPEPPRAVSHTGTEQQPKHNQRAQESDRKQTQLQMDRESTARKIEESEKHLKDLKKEVTRMRKDYERFHAQKCDIWDSAAKGAVSGAASGILSVATASLCALM